MVKLRLKRFGRRNRPFYRICAMDQRSARNSRSIEDLGFYDPVGKDADSQIRVDAERVVYWLEKGAQPTETVHDLLRKIGITAKPGNPEVDESQLPAKPAGAASEPAAEPAQTSEATA